MKYICSSCSAEFPRWAGKCPVCGQWGTLEEFDDSPIDSEHGKAVSVSKASFAPLGKYSKSDVRKGRISTGYMEFDRVLGGGLVDGEVVLLSGEPGVGKSTLLMQVVMNFAKEGKVLYVCGEESPAQLNSRFSRIFGKDAGALSKIDEFIVTEDTTAESITALIEQEKFELVVVDSIQSISSLISRGYAGSIGQVRVSGAMLTRVAKKTGTPIFIVGQINKIGDIAGPKVLEHIVDCVLYMEGDQYNQYRIIRSIKNRFGSTNEIGVFEMRGNGLFEVGNPSLLFLESGSESSGSAIGSIIQGSRVVFVEVQALVVERESEGGPLRRVANGIRKPRLDMLCAVMSRKGGVFLGNKDVFVNIVGGLNVNDPAIDLAVCAAIKSSIMDKALPKDVIYFGEVGLTGEVRGTWGVDSVITEAQRAGYSELVVGRMKVGPTKGIKVRKVWKITSI